MSQQLARFINQMWESEKGTHAFACEMWEQRDKAREALRTAKKKLQLYRAQHSGEYIGGMEFSALMQVIDEALK